MADGHRFDKNQLTVASNTYVLGTMLEVSRDGRTIEVTVTDTGELPNGRVLDLSEKAAEMLDMKMIGVDYVGVRELYVPQTPLTYHHENKSCMA